MYKTTIAFFTVALLAVFTQAAPSSELGAVKAFEERKVICDIFPGDCCGDGTCCGCWGCC
ncbi:hypothetical protein BT69DRAFT_1291481 [Atractiella rhizophila]|nr:hypothetical protein BT69DRAFT_1291481 [Atractiella rhizophila]